MVQHRPPLPAELELSKVLSELPNPQTRLNWIVNRVQLFPSWSSEERSRAHQVEGCLSKLWIRARRDSDAWCFDCDSDSRVVRGLAWLLCECSSGVDGKQLLERVNSPPLLDASTLASLTQTRRLGLYRCWAWMLEQVK